MSWVTIVWSMVVSACLTLGVLHFLVWVRQRTAWAHLFFFLSAAGTAAFAGCELWLMRAETTREVGLALRWAQVPAWVVVVSLVAFVRQYLRAGRVWLAWMVGGLRTLALVLNFSLTPNLNYREITAVRQVPFLGELVTVVDGVPSPWMLVGQASLLLLVIFVADATLAVWRRGDRQQAVVVGGSIVFFALGATSQTASVFWGLAHAPLTASLFYQGLVAVMGYQLSQDVIRAARLADELQQSQQGVRLAAAAAKIALWNWDIGSDLIWVTPEGRQLYDFPAHEVITSERFVATVHPEDRASIREALERSLRGPGDYQAEYRVVHPDGDMRWITARGKVEFNGQRRALRIRGVSLDITERKLAEQETQLHRDHVAHLSRVTTLGEISGSLAHELNQPLAAILANVQAAGLHLQRQTPDLDEVRAILEDIREDDLRAAEIINGIRKFLGRRQLETQALEVAQLAEAAIRLISGDTAARNTTVSLEIPPGLPRVTGDSIQLQQVLVNLLVNGMDAMNTRPAADRRIAIRATRLDPRTVEIAVSDTGVGISPGDLGRVFDPFHSTKQGGLGLGLAICRSIAEAHGGSIALENNLDRGTTARVRLPACEEGSS